MHDLQPNANLICWEIADMFVGGRKQMLFQINLADIRKNKDFLDINSGLQPSSFSLLEYIHQ